MPPKESPEMTTVLLKDHTAVQEKDKARKDQETEPATTANSPDIFPAIVPLKENPDMATMLLKDHTAVQETEANKETAVTTMAVIKRENTPIPTHQSPVITATRLVIFQETVLKKENQDKTTLREGTEPTRNTTTTPMTINPGVILVTNAQARVTFQEIALKVFNVSSANRVVTSLMNARPRVPRLIKD